MPGPYKKTAQLEVLQGRPGKNGLVGRPDADAFKVDVRWFLRWSKRYEKLVKAEMAVAEPDLEVVARLFELAFKCRVKAVDVKARLCVNLKPSKKKAADDKWAGLLPA